MAAPTFRDAPQVVGFLGVGTMNSALIRGLCEAAMERQPDTIPHMQELVRFPLLLGPPSTPRPETNQAKLLKEFGPTKIRVLESNAAILQDAGVVFLGVRPLQVEALIEAISTELHMTQTPSVVSFVSLVSTLKNHELHTLLVSKLASSTVTIKAIAKCVPLPAVQHLQGTTACCAYEGAAAPEGSDRIRISSSSLNDWCGQLFGQLGTAVPCKEEQFSVFQAVTGMMGPLYQHCSWIKEFMTAARPGSSSIDPFAAQAYVVSLLQGVLADVGHYDKCGPKTLEELMQEQTPGGLNEQAMRELSRQKDDTIKVLHGLKRRIEDTA